MTGTEIGEQGCRAARSLVLIAAVLAATVMVGCESGSPRSPLVYEDGPFKSCNDAWTPTHEETLPEPEPDPADPSKGTLFRAMDKETSSEWDIWGYASKGPMRDGRVRLRPYDRVTVSYWFAWNTVWPTSDLWARESGTNKFHTDPARFDRYKEADWGTDLDLFVGKGALSVLNDPGREDSGQLNPIYLGCYDERDCLPSLNTVDAEGQTLWARCEPRPIDERSCVTEPDGRKKCCDALLEPKKTQRCCHAVDLPPIKDYDKMTADQKAAIDHDYLRVKKWYLRENDPVIGVVINGEARAYPLKILRWHEVVNDVVPLTGDGPRTRFAVTYSTLTDSAALIDSVISADQATSFGISGYLFNSNHILYDRWTDSWWSPLRFQTIRGALRSEVPANMRGCPYKMTRETWSWWKLHYPNTRVLTADTGYARNYIAYPYRVTVNQPYPPKNYPDDDNNTFRITNPKPEHFAPKPSIEGYVPNKEKVLGIVTDGAQLAFLFRDVEGKAVEIRQKEENDASGIPELKDQAKGISRVDGGEFSSRSNGGIVINVEVGGLPLVIFWDSANLQYTAYERRTADGRVLTFEVTDPPPPPP